MIKTNLSNRTQMPYNQSLLYGFTNPDVWYDFSMGYGGNVPIARDLTGNGNHGTLNNLSSSWLPSSYGGMMNLDNTTAYNPGAGKSIVLPTLSTNSYGWYSFIIGFELGNYSLQSGASIIVGAYNYSSHDWWFGLNGNGYFSLSRNGSTIAFNSQVPQIGRRYIVRLASDHVGYNVNIADNTGVTWGQSAFVGALASTAGNVGIGKYGNYVDNFLGNIKLGFFMYYSGDNAGNVYQSEFYRYKLGIPYGNF